MLPYWDKINKCLENIVKACHKYGIKVVEHHSCHLTFDPLDSQDWYYMERVLNKRHSSIDSWEGLRDYLIVVKDGATGTVKEIENTIT